MPAKNVTFTAEWKPAVTNCTVTYELGEGGSWVYPDEAPAVSVAKGTEITLPGLYDVQKDGQEVIGWTIDGTNYDLGDTYTVDDDVTITAVWGTQKFTVAYSGGAWLREVHGRYEAGTKISLNEVPEDWKSDTKEFQGWQYSYEDAEDPDAVDGVVTKIYQPDDEEFTVPANDVVLTAKWNYVGINVTFIADKDDFSVAPVTVLYKPDNLESPGADYLDTFSAQVPNVDVTVPTGTQFQWIYEKSYEENETTYTEYVVCDMGAETLALLAELIAKGTEEVEVYGFVGKVVPNFTSTGWWIPSADTLNISYGQTVTLTGDMNPNGSDDFRGIFVSVGKAEGDVPVSVMMLYNGNVLNNSDGVNFGGLTHRAFGMNTTTSVTLSKYDNDEWAWDSIDYSVDTLKAMLGGKIGNYTVVVDYTSATQIVVTTSFNSTVVEKDSEDNDIEVLYKYVGVATHTSVNPYHGGLAQTYKLAICGETGSALKNGRFVVEGEVGEYSAPSAAHTYEEGVCTICGTKQQTLAIRNSDNSSTNYVLDLSYAVPATNYADGAAVNNGWWSGAFGATNVPEGDFALQFKYTRQHNFIDAAIQITLGTTPTGTCYLFGNTDVWSDANNFIYGYSLDVTVNGEAAEQPTNTGDNLDPSNFWFGDYTVTIIRDGDKLYMVCDFVRMNVEDGQLVEIDPESADYYHLVEVYTILNAPTEAGSIQISGWCADLVGTVASGTFTK